MRTNATFTLAVSRRDAAALHWRCGCVLKRHRCPCRTQAREELRLQTGTLRFDISTLASQLDKSKRKEALKLGDAFYAKVRWSFQGLLSCRDGLDVQPQR